MKSASNTEAIPRLNNTAMRILVSEENSNEYVIDAHNRQIESIDDLSEVPNLKSLDISFNKIKKLENLQSAKCLKEIKAYNNHISDISSLQSNTALENLYLSHNKIRKLPQALEKLRHAQILRLDGNLIQSMDNLPKSLMHLDLGRNRLRGICSKGLESLAALVSLNLSDNNFDELGPLKCLRRLEELNVSGNKIASINGLHGLLNLKVLRVSRNCIKSIQSLPKLKYLNELYIDNNAISDLSQLVKSAPALELLNAKNCRIRSTDDLSAIKALQKLEDVWFQGNPCSLSSEYYVNVCKELPHIETVDDTSKQQILDAPESIVHQRPMSASKFGRPMTNGRVVTPSMRPTTPGQHHKRPTTAEGRPVFYQPSARAGNPVSMLSVTEIQDSFAEFRDRIKAVKSEITDLGSARGQNNEDECGFTVEENELFHERPVSSRGRPDSSKKSTASVGTDPLSNTTTPQGSIFSFAKQLESESPVIKSVMEQSPELDIESQMKLELSQNLKSNNSEDESPRLPRVKSAGRKRSVPSYKGFRVPTKAKQFIEASISL